MRRRRLLRRTGARSAGGEPVAGDPEAASNRLSASSLKNTFLFCAEQQATGLQCANHLLGERIAAGHDGVDTLNRFVEAVGKEMGEGILVGVRAGRRGGDAQNTQGEYQRQQAFAEGAHVSSPGIAVEGAATCRPWIVSWLLGRCRGASAPLVTLL
jgi:hypothetical protein